MNRMLIIAFLAAAAVSNGPASAKTQAFSVASLTNVSRPVLISEFKMKTPELPEKFTICPDVLNGPGGMIILAQQQSGLGSLTATPKGKKIGHGQCCGPVLGGCVSWCPKSGGCTGQGDCSIFKPK